MSVDGNYVLQTWASVAQVDPSLVITNFKNRYGVDAVSYLGKMAQGVNFEVLKGQFVSIQGSDYNLVDLADPKKVDLTQALLNVGGTLPSTTSIVANGVEAAASDIASGALSGLKWVAIALVAGAVIYLGVQTGALKGVLRRA